MIIYIAIAILSLIVTLPTAKWDVVMLDQYDNSNRIAIRMRVSPLLDEDQVLIAAEKLADFPFQPYRAYRA